MTDIFRSKLVMSNLPMEDKRGFKEYGRSTTKGFYFVPEPYGGLTESLAADFGDFVKWVRNEYPDTPVSFPTGVPRIALHGADLWLPLVYLASDTSMQIFLSMVSNYLYDKAKGQLKTEHPRVHVSVIYEDKKQGRTKKFEFSGDQETLTKAIKRFDLDNFFNDAS